MSPWASAATMDDIWLRTFFSDWTYNPHAISGDDFEVYVRAYKAPGRYAGPWPITGPTPRMSSKIWLMRR